MRGVWVPLWSRRGPCGPPSGTDRSAGILMRSAALTGLSPQIWKMIKTNKKQQQHGHIGHSHTVLTAIAEVATREQQTHTTSCLMSRGSGRLHGNSSLRIT